MADFSLVIVVEGLLFSSHYLPPWKIYMVEFLNCDHLGVAYIGNGAWGDRFSKALDDLCAAMMTFSEK